LGTMMIPEEVILLPLYMVVRSLGLLDTRLGTILALSPWGLTIYILMGFFRTIPHELEESATIDGANKFLVFRSIIMPISTAALTAVVVFVSVAVWGHIIIPWTIIQSEHLMTIPLALKTFQRQHNYQYNLILAGATLASIPIIVIFASLKRYFIQGAVMGALKE
jgi:ABC-type glycerol-3-phosphate transport system permease component